MAGPQAWARVWKYTALEVPDDQLCTLVTGLKLHSHHLEQSTSSGLSPLPGTSHKVQGLSLATDVLPEAQR